MENKNNRLGSLIKEIRLEKKITQDAVAQDFFSTRHLINIEAGKVDPSIEIVLHICSKLMISIEELFTRLYLKDQQQLKEAEREYTHLFENGNFSDIYSTVSPKLNLITNTNVCSSILFNFLSIMVEYYQHLNEKFSTNRLKELIEVNTEILNDLSNSLHVNILIQYIQVSSYSDEALSLALATNYIEDCALTYAINTGLLLKMDWQKTTSNCQNALEEATNQDCFIFPGIYFQLGLSLIKQNQLKDGHRFLKDAYTLATLNKQTYYLKGFEELLNYFHVTNKPQ